jgi:hypothetical protein
MRGFCRDRVGNMVDRKLGLKVCRIAAQPVRALRASFASASSNGQVMAYVINLMTRRYRAAVSGFPCNDVR